jgi:hypothetical protein
MQIEALQVALQLEENQYQRIDPAIEELKEDLKNLTFQLNQNKKKRKMRSRFVHHMQNGRTPQE